MNCKPGDLAIQVRVMDKVAEPNLGLLCRVVKASDEPGEWVIDLLTRVWGEGRWWPANSHRLIVAQDCCLRPIRDPGDSARDNAWDWLPAVPTKELA